MEKNLWSFQSQITNDQKEIYTLIIRFPFRTLIDNLENQICFPVLFSLMASVCKTFYLCDVLKLVQVNVPVMFVLLSDLTSLLNPAQLFVKIENREILECLEEHPGVPWSAQQYQGVPRSTSECPGVLRSGSPQISSHKYKSSYLRSQALRNHTVNHRKRAHSGVPRSWAPTDQRSGSRLSGPSASEPF